MFPPLCDRAIRPDDKHLAAIVDGVQRDMRDARTRAALVDPAPSIMLDHGVHEFAPQAIAELRVGGEEPMLVSCSTAASFGFGAAALGAIHSFLPQQRSHLPAASASAGELPPAAARLAASQSERAGRAGCLGV
jgi:hypothetical protein